jgi:hypothetical protein
MTITGRKFNADGFDAWSKELNEAQAHEVRQLAHTYAERMGRTRPTEDEYVTAANTLHGRRGCKPNLMHGDILIDAIAR